MVGEHVTSRLLFCSTKRGKFKKKVIFLNLTETNTESYQPKGTHLVAAILTYLSVNVGLLSSFQFFTVENEFILGKTRSRTETISVDTVIQKSG